METSLQKQTKFSHDMSKLSRNIISKHEQGSIINLHHDHFVGPSQVLLAMYHPTTNQQHEQGVGKPTTIKLRPTFNLSQVKTKLATPCHDPSPNHMPIINQTLATCNEAIRQLSHDTYSEALCNEPNTHTCNIVKS